jgi:hypothetical protein
LSLLTIFIILSFDIGTVNLLNKFFEPAIAQDLIPNADMYMEEPYSSQQNLTGNNFAFREYYKGDISTGDTYLGNVVISTASGLTQSYIAVPLYSSASVNNETLLGIWSGGLNHPVFSKTLQSLNLTDGERIVHVDQNG